MALEAAGAGLRPPRSPSMVLCPWGSLTLGPPFSRHGGLGVPGPLAVLGIGAAQGLRSRVGCNDVFEQLRKKSHRPMRGESAQAA